MRWSLLAPVPLACWRGLLGLLGRRGRLVFSPSCMLLGLSPTALAQHLAIVPTTFREGNRLPLRSGGCRCAMAPASDSALVASGLIFSRLGGLVSGCT